MYYRIINLIKTIKSSQYQYNLMYFRDAKRNGFSRLPALLYSRKRDRCNQDAESSRKQLEDKTEESDYPVCKPGHVERPKGFEYKRLPLYRECEECECEPESSKKDKLKPVKIAFK